MLRIRLIAAAIAAMGIALAGCSDTSSSLFKPSKPPTQVLQFETVPPGADVRTADGQTCRTPCSLAVPATAQSANVAMAGYMPLTVAVAVHQDNVFSPIVFTPNPVEVTLQAVQPPKPVTKPRPQTAANPAPKTKTAAKSAAPQPAPMSARAPAPMQDSAFPPPPPMAPSPFPPAPPQPAATR